MKIQTFSIVVGGNKCNANCPYCVSKLTGKLECSDKFEKINMRNLHKALQFAKMSGVSTILLTGKGEPLLYPEHISQYLELIKDYGFPFVELQTNGMLIPKMEEEGLLGKWYYLGLTTVSLSCVHWFGHENREIFGKDYKEPSTYADIIHEAKLSVRLSCVMYSGKVSTVGGVRTFAKKCKEWGIEQLTCRPVTNISWEEVMEAANNGDFSKQKIYNWIKKHEIDFERKTEIERSFRSEATLLLELAHGAKVYDYKGQNISLNTCLTSSSDPNDIRQLIFFPDGRLMYDWVLQGAIII